jgi:RHS repeat-associated protein
MRYPKLTGQTAGTKVVYDYASATTGNGRLSRVRVAEPAEQAATVWTAKATDVQDRLVQEEFGDGTNDVRSLDWRGATLEEQTQTAASDVTPSRVLLSQRYGYDAEGNVLHRSRTNPGQPLAIEAFSYDALDRVSSLAVHVANTTTLADEWRYDSLGNIVYSKRRGTYDYAADRPTQVVSITGGLFGNRTFGYDAVGNQTSRPDGLVSYNDFNLPARIAASRGEQTAALQYYGTGERARKVSSAGTTSYLPGLYERHRDGDTTEHRLLVQAAGRTVATLVYREQQQPVHQLVRQPTRYLHTDRLGSTNLVTSNGAPELVKALVLENRSYDAFGAPRNPDLRTGDAGFTEGVEPPAVDQGYAGHDDDRELGLVDMGGRIYDPALARFLTPDPNVDGANPSQAWNRYAYVSNNPLRHTDPTGFLTCFGCPEDEFGGSGGSGGPMSPVEVLMNEWMAESDAWFEGSASGEEGAGAWAINPLNPNSPAGHRLDDAAERHSDAIERHIAALEAERERQEKLAKEKAERAEALERLKLWLQELSEMKEMAGSDAVAGDMLAENDVCQPGACSTDIARDFTVGGVAGAGGAGGSEVFGGSIGSGGAAGSNGLADYVPSFIFFGIAPHAHLGAPQSPFGFGGELVGFAGTDHDGRQYAGYLGAATFQIGGYHGGGGAEWSTNHGFETLTVGEGITDFNKGFGIGFGMFVDRHGRNNLFMSVNPGKVFTFGFGMEF